MHEGITEYEAPKVYTFGTIVELTSQDDKEDKCGGTADFALPQQLSPDFSTDCP